MSEQTKNKPNTAEIVVSIICALILIVTLGLFARNVITVSYTHLTLPTIA